MLSPGGWVLSTPFLHRLTMRCTLVGIVAIHTARSCIGAEWAIFPAITTHFFSHETLLLSGSPMRDYLTNYVPVTDWLSVCFLFHSLSRWGKRDDLFQRAV